MEFALKNDTSLEIYSVFCIQGDYNLVDLIFRLSIFFLAPTFCAAIIFIHFATLSHPHTLEPRARYLKLITRTPSDSNWNNFSWLCFFSHLLSRTIFRFPWDCEIAGFNCEIVPFKCINSIVVIFCVLVVGVLFFGRFYAKKAELINVINPVIKSTINKRIKMNNFFTWWIRQWNQFIFGFVRSCQWLS